MTVIDDVKERLDIVQVVSSYVNLQKAGRNFKALCPFHAEKQPSFYVFPERQSWHCFGACSTGGDIFSFVMKKENVDFAGALRMLAEKAGVPLVPRGVKQEAEAREKERLYQLNETVAQYYHYLFLNASGAAPARAYVERRGLTAETVRVFQLGYSPEGWEVLKRYLMDKGYQEKELLDAGLLVVRDTGGSYDRFRGRLIFPIRDMAGRVTGFGARVLDSSLPKYINSPQTAVFDKSSALYGIDRAKAAIREKDLAVIVEGYMDVIMAHQYGETNVVASMGIALTDRQIAVLKKLTRNLALALDADAAGEEATLRVVTAEGGMATDVVPVPTWSGMVRYENTLGAEVRVVVLPPGHDPDEVIKEDPEKWRQLVAKAPPVLDYAIEVVVSRADLSKAREKSAVADRLLPIIGDVKDPVRQAHYIQRLAGVLQTDEKVLWGALKLLKPLRGRVLERADTRPVTGVTLRDPIEEYCLALLVQYPDLRPFTEGLLPEYFESSESRELLLRLKNANGPAAVRDSIDDSLKEYYDQRASRPLPPLLSENESERRQSLS
ncbi:MAG: DNA primase, partial [Dehalococcoidia bacterium]|nr:DNA primase [Dehalococcoidia bacterium]